MLSEDRLSDSNSFFSSQTIFDLIYHLQERRKEQQYLPLVFYLANALIHLVLFLAVPTIGYLDFPKKVASTQLFISLLVVYGVVFLQVLIQLIKKKNFYLMEQIEFLSFVVEPVLLINAIALIYSGDVSILTGLLVCAGAEMLASLIFQELLFESYRTYSLSGEGAYITNTNTLYQMLLIGLAFVTLTKFQGLLGCILLGLSISTYLKHFVKIEMDCLEYRVLKGVNLLHIVISLILVYSEVIGLDVEGISLVVSLLVMIYLGVALVNKQKEEEVRFKNAFQMEAGYQEMLKTIDFFTGLIRKTGHEAHNNLYKFVFSAISEHNKECTRATCEFSTVTVPPPLPRPSRNSKNPTPKTSNNWSKKC